jgi:L-threonylcarbamoyladenylate synthase
VILDGGPCQVGVESTIIDCTSDTPQILRLGAITKEMIQESTGLLVIDEAPTDIPTEHTIDSIAKFLFNGKTVINYRIL